MTNATPAPSLRDIAVAALLAKAIKMLHLEDRVGTGRGHVSIAVGHYTIMIVDERA